MTRIKILFPLRGGKNSTLDGLTILNACLDENTVWVLSWIGLSSNSHVLIWVEQFQCDVITDAIRPYFLNPFLARFSSCQKIGIRKRSRRWQRNDKLKLEYAKVKAINGDLWFYNLSDDMIESDEEYLFHNLFCWIGI